MSAIYLLLTGVCVFVLAYRYYSAFVAAKVLMLDDHHVTPAIKKNDKREFVPTNRWIVFGHHFSAIAGAGPLIGPTLAAQYGWGPGFFWIILGSVFGGIIHDMIALYGSVRHGGQGMAVVAREEVGQLSGTITAIVALLIILITMAGMGAVVANALFANPWGVFSTAMTIPIAMAVGIYLFRGGSVLWGSVVGVVLICAGVILGQNFASSALAEWLTFNRHQLSVLLPAYTFVAAVLPIWLILTPRGYLSTYIKLGVIVAMAIGLFFVNPTIKMPFTTQFLSGGGPVIPGPVWPYVFITIACGAISGFHSLIGSGTTSKIIEKETHVRLVGGGAMLAESFVALMALIAAVLLDPGDYFAINSSPAVFAKLNIPIHNLDELSRLVGLDIAGRPGGAISLAVGMAQVFASIGGGIEHTMKYWFQALVMFEALFIFSALDTSTRVARYMLQHALGVKQNWLPGVLITSAIISASWGYLVYTGEVSSLWPLFGVTNQALASLTLAIGTTMILKLNRNKYYALVSGVPCLLLTITTCTAGVLNTIMFFSAAKYVNACLSAITITMVISVVTDNIQRWARLWRR